MEKAERKVGGKKAEPAGHMANQKSKHSHSMHHKETAKLGGTMA